MEYQFFVPGYIESVNRRQKRHWGSRHRKDKEKQKAWSAVIAIHCPKEALVGGPHRKRQVALCVFRWRKLDYDNLVGGLKPFIDVLRCWREKHTKVVVWQGVIYDDSPKYVKWDIDQRIIGVGDAEGVLVTVQVPGRKVDPAGRV